MARRLALVAAVLALTLAGCSIEIVSYPAQDVRYEVLTDGWCTAYVTYLAGYGDVRHETVASGWRYERPASYGDFLYVSAQSECWSGFVTANIYEWYGPYEGGDPPSGSYVLVRSSTSYAPYGTATASKTY